ncbi:EamA family transporter [Nanoarchaeota archaeon]
MATEVWAMGVIIVASMIASAGALLIKEGAAKFSLNPIKLLKDHLVIIGGFLYVISTVMFIFALRYGELSVLYPFASTTYIWVTILSMHFLNEKMNWEKWMGIVFIILGVSIIGFGG